MRGSATGALTRTYLHSIISEALWCAVAESERLFDAKLAHAMMLAALYGNPAAGLDKGNEQVHEMYINALGAIPYFRTVTQKASRSETEALVEEWYKANEGVDAQAHGKEGDNV